MSKNDSGDKTEKPTPKRLKDAREKGDVAKSQEVTNTVVLTLWFVLFSFGLVYAGERIISFFDMTLATSMNGNFMETASNLGWGALETLLMISAVFLLPVVLFGLLVEFLQTGPVLTFEKIKPKIENMNPAEGLKRMFGMDSLVEGLKSLLKTALIFFIGWMVIKALLPELLLLLHGKPNDIVTAMWEVAFKILVWTVGIFVFFSILDAAYQRHSFEKKLRMSMRDIKQEVKDTEGDPHIKAQRKQMHQEWSQEGNVRAAQDATALIVNPTHVAIAINYDKDECPVPTIAAKGEDHVARAMREAAERANVPIVRNVPLARDLLARGEVGELIPRDLFDIIAEVILWANQVREKMDNEKYGYHFQHEEDDSPSEKRKYEAPGEDLTVYPNA